MDQKSHFLKKSQAYIEYSELLYKHKNSLDFSQKKLANELVKSLYIQKNQIEKIIKRNDKK